LKLQSKSTNSSQPYRWNSPCFRFFPLSKALRQHAYAQMCAKPFLWLFMLFSFLCPGMNAQATTIEGIILDDKGPASASVTAYRSFADLNSKTNGIASSEGSKPGQYKLDIPPGKYYFVASNHPNFPPLFAYHGLNPITVGHADQWIPFFLQPERPAKCEPGYQGIGGTVYYKGTPLSHGSVSVYTLEDEPFRGMGVLTNSIGESGSFWFDLSPGKYVVIARQRQDDTAIGPLKKGDLFCYSTANPIEIHPANTCQTDLLCYPRDDMEHYLAQGAQDPRGRRQDARRDASLQNASMQEAGTKGASGGPLAIIAGRVTDLDGRPMPGLVVSAYPADDLPLFQMYVLRFKSEFIVPTDKKGFFRLEVQPGSYYLVAREKVGDAPNVGEHYGLFEGNANHSLNVGQGETKNGIQLIVEPIMP